MNKPSPSPDSTSLAPQMERTRFASPADEIILGNAFRELARMEEKDAQRKSTRGDADLGEKEPPSETTVSGQEKSFTGSRFISIPRAGITLGCISPEARDLLDRVMEAWELHLANLKKSNGDDYEPGHYGFAYWLIRWSGLVAPSVSSGAKSGAGSGVPKDSSPSASAAVEQETGRITAEMLQHWWFVLAGDRNHWHFLADQINAYFKEKEPSDRNALNLQMAQLRDAVEADKNHDDDNPDPPQDEHDCFCVRCCAIRFLSSHAPKSSSATSVSSPKSSSPSPSLPVIEGEKWSSVDNVVYSPGGQKQYQLYFVAVAQDLVEEINASLERVKKAKTDLGK